MTKAQSEAATDRWAKTDPDKRREHMAKPLATAVARRKAASSLLDVAEDALVAAGAKVTWPSA